MATAVWSIQHRQKYGNCSFVCTAQTAVWQLLIILYSTEGCMETTVLSVQHRQADGNCSFVYNAQRDVWQLLFGLYSTESCMATCLCLRSTDSCIATSVWTVQHRKLYDNFCFVYTARTADCQLLLIYTAQTAVWQLLFGLYSTDSCMASSVH